MKRLENNERKGGLVQVSRKSLLMLRISSSLIFIIAGLGHLMAPDKMLDKLEQSPIGKSIMSLDLIPDLVQITGLPLVLLGLMFMLGFKTRLAASGLAALLIPITISAQIGAPELVGPLFKNIAIFGVLLFFIFNQGLNLKNQE